MIRFDYEEAELLNSFIASSAELPTRQSLINRIFDSGSDHENPEIIVIARSTVNKLKSIDEQTFNRIIEDLPVDNNTVYK